MDQMLVLIRYRTKSGVNAVAVAVFAASLDEAIAKASDMVRRRRGVIRIEGGEAWGCEARP